MDATPILARHFGEGIEADTAAVNPATSRVGKEGNEWLPHQDTAHFALLAQTGEAVVGLASCVPADPGAAELGVLVEDSWQRVGVGTRLLRLLVAHGDQGGLTRLKACVLASQAWMLPVLGSYGTCEAWLRRGVFEVKSTGTAGDPGHESAAAAALSPAGPPQREPDRDQRQVAGAVRIGLRQ